MKPEEFKVGQVIKCTNKTSYSERYVKQTVLKIKLRLVTTDLTRFASDSKYAEGCVLVKEPFHAKWKIKGSKEFSEILKKLPINNPLKYSGEGKQFYFCINDELKAWRAYGDDGDFTTVTVEQLKDYYLSIATAQTVENEEELIDKQFVINQLKKDAENISFGRCSVIRFNLIQLNVLIKALEQ